MPRIPIIGAILLVMLMLAVSACAPQQAPAPGGGGWDDVLAAAKSEGTVTLYSTFGTQVGEALKAGMTQYGINLEIIGGRGGELEQKLFAEQRAEAYTADLFMGGWTNQLRTLEAGYGQPVTVSLPTLEEKDVWSTHPSQYEPSGNVFMIGAGVTPSIIANSDQVKKDEIKSWQDLLDPKWKGKIVMQEARTGSGPGTSGMYSFQNLGEDFWKKLAANDLTFQTRYGTTVDQVATGEKAMAIFPAFSRTQAAIKAGAPIMIVHLEEGTTYFANGLVYVKNAPHPNASMVFLNWLLSKEGQRAYCTALQAYTIRNDVTQDWIEIPELRAGTFKRIEPPNNLKLTNAAEGTAFSKKVFGEQ
ncbi:MAG: ABC transporter substrate-binding protein [Candidatus Thorarchaeota archaeon]|jgi:iron(III) transport system substrate-binding protein